jgi:predicted cation transporter
MIKAIQRRKIRRTTPDAEDVTKTTQRLEPVASRILRVLTFLIAIVLFSTTRIPLHWLYLQPWPAEFWSFWLGAIVMVAGLLFAVWARVYLGGN